MQLLESFQAANYTITYASPAELSPHAEDLASYGIASNAIELNSESFDHYLAELTPDAVLFDRFMMEEQFGWRVEKVCPDALRILDTEDLHCLRHARHQAFKNKASLKDTLNVSQRLLFNDLAKREIASILRCDLSLMISQAEMTLLTQTFNVPEQIIHYVPFMRTSVKGAQDSSPLALTPFAERKHFISIGNFRHEPNWDAVRFLKEAIWPAIRQQLPEAELHIYGAYPPKKATQLHNEKQRFLVKGWAVNAFEVVSKARVLLAPLRFGAGLKGKLIDAAECGTPAVTTSIGAEGMYGNALPARISDDKDEFAKAAIELYSKEESWQSLHQECSLLIPERFELDLHQQRLIDRITLLENELEQERQNNFTGSMLRHHSMKSTQYMAQWIEAKNKLLPQPQK
ncbi:glycosyltransferase [Litoribacillus peritrichatus]|uniref:Glycosyltransferase n=2 Tax=Litoribacillus peritrichatus TaxID=718191 RepID=A0ABP7M9R8_9GAMM